jgi:NAD(P)H-nitrite reductase large subunit
VVEIIGVDSAREIMIASLDDDWSPRPGGRIQLPADVVGMSFGLRPNTELTQLAGCDHVYEAPAGGWRVRRNAGYATSIANVYAIGDGAGIGGVDTALAEGVILAYDLAPRLGAATAAIDADADQAQRSLAALAGFRRGLVAWSGIRPGIFRAADAGTMICRCEDVRSGDIDQALAAGIALPRGLKLRTRAGMGLCQGRTCAPAIQQRIADRAGMPIADVPMPTVRVPLRPVSVAALATLVPTTAGE